MKGTSERAHARRENERPPAKIRSWSALLLEREGEGAVGPALNLLLEIGIMLS